MLVVLSKHIVCFKGLKLILLIFPETHGDETGMVFRDGYLGLNFCLGYRPLSLLRVKPICYFLSCSVLSGKSKELIFLC